MATIKKREKLKQYTFSKIQANALIKIKGGAMSYYCEYKNSETGLACHPSYDLISELILGHQTLIENDQKCH